MIVYKPIRKVSAMSFDLDDTLYDNWPHIIGAENKLIEFIKKQYPKASSYEKADWQGFKKQSLKHNPSLCNDMGLLRKQTLITGFKAAGYDDQELEAAAQTCFDWFYHQRSNFSVNKPVLDVLERLARKYPLVAITNGNVNLEQIGISHFFLEYFKASIDAPMKPDPFMFNEAVNYLNLPPEEILHVGDNLEKDVWGAENAGLSSAWFAVDREMDINKEPVRVLPNIQLSDLSDLLDI